MALHRCFKNTTSANGERERGYSALASSEPGGPLRAPAPRQNVCEDDERVVLD